MSQYALPLTLPTAYRADNFLASASNRDALAWIDCWPDWGHAKALLLSGPSGSGKTHLGHIWAGRASATIIPASALNIWQPAAGNWLVEDIESTPQATDLLHLYNYVREQGGTLLLTAKTPAAQLPFTLPDLTSRLLALPSAHLDEPDDEILAGAIRKQFTDRQMKIDPEVIAYLIPRIERSFAAAQILVGQLDRLSLAEGKNITIPFVKKTLENQYQPLLEFFGIKTGLKKPK